MSIARVISRKKAQAEKKVSKAHQRASRRIPAEAISAETVDQMLERLYIEARDDFWKFRCMINPKLKRGWFPQELAYALQEFYDDLIAGKRPKYVIQSPPQHGKSTTIIDFMAWVAGKHPEWKQFYTAYGEGLGEKAMKAIQRIVGSNVYKQIFPDTHIPNEAGYYGDKKFVRNLSELSFIHKDMFGENVAEGFFKNTTIPSGAITGEGLDMGVVDDPIKGRAEANSKTIRDKVWDWLTDDFFSRFAEAAGLLMVMTRWHLDDPAGRLILSFNGVKVFKWPATATKDEPFRKKGEPLFPEHKSLAFLNERRNLYTKASWESLYQQNPIIAGGMMFPVEKYKIVTMVDRREILASVRYWDKAGTENDGAFTCGTLMHKMKDGTFIISDVKRGQWGSLQREQNIKQCAQIDNGSQFTTIYVEQEPGSGGKESAENTIRMLAGFVARADKVTGDKETRAEPYAAFVQAGNVKLLAAVWNRAFLDEHETFPGSTYKDQVDATAGAFNKLVGGSSYDRTYAWVG